MFTKIMQTASYGNGSGKLEKYQKSTRESTTNDACRKAGLFGCKSISESNMSLTAVHWKEYGSKSNESVQYVAVHDIGWK